MAVVKLGGTMHRRSGPGLRKPVSKTPKFRLRQRLRKQGYTKKQAFRVTSSLAKGGGSRRRTMTRLNRQGFGRKAMTSARRVNHPRVGRTYNHHTIRGGRRVPLGGGRRR
jgi:hypothetical protein